MLHRPGKSAANVEFGIYGFSEYFRASGDKESLDLAISLFHKIEEYSYDSEYGGYLEAFDQQWKELSDMRLSEKDQNFPKSMNTHLHILEPYTNLYRIWKDEELERKIQYETKFLEDKNYIKKQEEYLNLKERIKEEKQERKKGTAELLYGISESGKESDLDSEIVKKLLEEAEDTAAA